MSKKIKATPQLLADLIARVPEGLLHKATLTKRMVVEPDVIEEARTAGWIEREGAFYYDPARVTPEQVRAFYPGVRPPIPPVKRDGTFFDAPIRDRLAAREAVLSDEDRHLINRLLPQGFVTSETLVQSPEDEARLRLLLDKKALRRMDEMIYDPLHVSETTVNAFRRSLRLEDSRQQVFEFLAVQPGSTAPRETLSEKFGRKNINDLVNAGDLVSFWVTSRKSVMPAMWVRPKKADANLAQDAAEEASRIHDEDWLPVLEAAGDLLRPGAREGITVRSKAVARTYTLSNAAKRLGAKPATLEDAAKGGLLTSVTDPEGHTRLSAQQIEAAVADPNLAAQIAGFEQIKARDIAIVTGLTAEAVRYRLQKANISRTLPTWAQIQGRWGLPSTLKEFREQLRAKKAEWRVHVREERAREDEEAQTRWQVEIERRESLRARLVAAFPTWKNDRRAQQQIILHLGPPNSGKTHDALNALAQAGSGWYLGPLRLLAFEVFDRLNARGVPCNLLTGEEHIPIPGARITAATIEMFNANISGDCVIIDEAQMLADPDRGWAWTRALMEAQAPEIHVIGPYTAESLIRKLAEAAAIPMAVQDHERLAPIRVADKPWPLYALPPRTILVAFSRRMVLFLKSELEHLRRSVSVIYGNLPPEVRRKQSDRFANGETEICVATDAVGMGLNLPADYVCFYEVEKFDGQQMRTLKPAEVQQIGGRAGRFGISASGEVGATTRYNLRTVSDLFYAEADPLVFARVAPTVEDIEMLPGILADRLQQWASLESIPDNLRGVLTMADLSEQIELARMLDEDEVRDLGLATAIKLTNAPTRETTRWYWRECATAILSTRAMPLPPSPPPQIRDDLHLEDAEHSINCADIYLWLASRREFDWFAPHEEQVRKERTEWSALIDLALLRRIDSARRCSRCNRRLPPHHAYSICDDCYHSGASWRSR